MSERARTLKLRRREEPGAEHVHSAVARRQRHEHAACAEHGAATPRRNSSLSCDIRCVLGCVILPDGAGGAPAPRSSTALALQQAPCGGDVSRVSHPFVRARRSGCGSQRVRQRHALRRSVRQRSRRVGVRRVRRGHNRGCAGWRRAKHEPTHERALAQASQGKTMRSLTAALKALTQRWLKQRADARAFRSRTRAPGRRSARRCSAFLWSAASRSAKKMRCTGTMAGANSAVSAGANASHTGCKLRGVRTTPAVRQQQECGKQPRRFVREMHNCSSWKRREPCLAGSAARVLPMSTVVARDARCSASQAARARRARARRHASGEVCEWPSTSSAAHRRLPS
jgi:hypothetical protein